MSRRDVRYTVRTRESVGIGRILIHTILTCLTGGLWLVLLLIRYLLR